jgi:hypothetical protein
MTHHPANSISFEPHFRPPFRQFSAGDESVRVLLVAIHHSPQPAAFLGSHPLQRLQVLLAAPGDEVEFERPDTKARATAGAPAQVLPQMSAAPGDLRLRPRLVQGEILSDDGGRLFERVGSRIRPLQRLFSGPRGEVLELPVEAQVEQQTATPQPINAEASKAEARTRLRAEAPPERRRHPQQSFRRPPPRPMRPASAPRPQARKDEAHDQQRQQAPATGCDHAIRQRDLQPPAMTPIDRAASGLKTTIPEQWIRQWEFQLSREEAIYDMQVAASFHNSLIAVFRNLTGWFGHRQAWRKWQALLAGKRPDEQLWAVRPPQRLITHSAVREWARQTLEQAGYDASAMLIEWEIFWRRKGL